MEVIFEEELYGILEHAFFTRTWKYFNQVVMR